MHRDEGVREGEEHRSGKKYPPGEAAKTKGSGEGAEHQQSEYESVHSHGDEPCSVDANGSYQASDQCAANDHRYGPVPCFEAFPAPAAEEADVACVSDEE